MPFWLFLNDLKRKKNFEILLINPFTGGHLKKLDKYEAKFWNNFKYLLEYIWLSICTIDRQNLSFDCKFCLNFKKLSKMLNLFIEAWNCTPAHTPLWFAANIVITVATCINLKKIAIIMIINMYNQEYHVRVWFPCLREASF